MLGAIAGDIIGSRYERAQLKSKEFTLFAAGSTFTDDSVLTIAVADALLGGRDYVAVFHEYFLLYPNAGYGGTYYRWAINRSTEPYNSWGNGSAMRVSPIAWARDSLAEVIEEAARSAAVTHNHPEGIRGAQATAAAVFLARKGNSKERIRGYLESTFGYGLGARLDDIRPGYAFDVSCAGSVPESIIAFLESSDYEDAIRNAISLGGDADTMACIAEAFYGGVPEHVRLRTLEHLDARLRGVVDAFAARYGK